MQRQRHLVLKDAGLIGARPPETGPARAAETSKRIAIPVWSRHCIKLERYPKIGNLPGFSLQRIRIPTGERHFQRWEPQKYDSIPE